MNLGKTVLIVEDENSLAEPLKLKLKKAGYTVFRGKNGKEGLELFGKNHPDIILLDINMPIMSGSEMLEKLREDDWGSSVPVIVLSNVSDSATIYNVISQSGKTNTLNDYLVKLETSLKQIIELIKLKTQE